MYMLSNDTINHKSFPHVFFHLYGRDRVPLYIVHMEPVLYSQPFLRLGVSGLRTSSVTAVEEPVDKLESLELMTWFGV